MPSVPRRDLNDPELERLFAAIDPDDSFADRDRALLRFMFHTGLRVGESLDERYVDWRSIVMTAEFPWHRGFRWHARRGACAVRQDPFGARPVRLRAAPRTEPLA